MRFLILLFMAIQGCSQCIIVQELPIFTPVSTGIILDIDFPFQIENDTIINQSFATSPYSFETLSQHTHEFATQPKYMSADPSPLTTQNEVAFIHPTAPANRIILGGDMSIEMVFRLDPQTTPRSNFHGGSGSFQQLRILYDGVNAWRHGWRWDFASNRAILSTTFTTDPEQWTHLLMTYTASTRELKYYINNQLLETDVRPASDPVNLNTDALFDRSSTASNAPFFGDIGIYRIYAHDLSATEVENNYNYANSFFNF